MKFENSIFTCCALMALFLGFLQCENLVDLNDPQVIKQQTEDVATFASMVTSWKNAIEKYSQKNNIDLEIKCKNCDQRVLSLGEFDGCLLAWIIKAISDGHDAFEKNKAIAEAFIKLLSDNASAEELINFMLKTSNDMKQVCTNCHGVIWEKIA